MSYISRLFLLDNRGYFWCAYCVRSWAKYFSFLLNSLQSGCCSHSSTETALTKTSSDLGSKIRWASLNSNLINHFRSMAYWCSLLLIHLLFLDVNETTLSQLFLSPSDHFCSDYSLRFHSYLYSLLFLSFSLVLIFSQSLFSVMIATTIRAMLFLFHFIFWILTHMVHACWIPPDDTVILDSMCPKQNPVIPLSGLFLILGFLIRNLTVTF